MKTQNNYPFIAHPFAPTCKRENSLRRVLSFMLACLVCAGIASATDLPLPQKAGESFMVDDFDFKVTKFDLGFNYFGGNMGALMRIRRRSQATG